MAELTRTIAAALGRISLPLAKTWLYLSRCNQRDRVQVAYKLINQNASTRARVLTGLDIAPQIYARHLETTSTVEAFRTVEELCPDDVDSLARLAHQALSRGENGSYDLVQSIALRAPDHQRLLWQAAVERDPLQSVRRRARFTGISDEAISLALDSAISHEPLGVPYYLEELLPLSPEQSERLTNTLIKKDPNLFFQSAGELNLSPPSLLSAMKSLIERGPVTFLKHCREVALPEEEKAALVHAVFVRDAEQALEYLEDLLSWSTSVKLPETLPDEQIARFWKRILAHREELGFIDPEAVRSLVFQKLETHPKLVYKNLAELSLAGEPFAGDVARKLAEVLPKESPSIAGILRIADPATINPLAEKLARVDPATTLKWVSSLGIQLPAHVQSIVVEELARKTPWSFFSKIGVASDLPNPDLATLLVFCARDNAARMCREVSRQHIDDQAIRERLFVECARRNLWTTLDHSQNFRVSNTPGAREVFGMALRRDPIRAADYRLKLGLTGDDDRRLTLLTAVKKNAAQALLLLRDREIPDRIVADTLSIAFRRNPSLFSRASKTITRLRLDLQCEVIASRANGHITRAEGLWSGQKSTIAPPPELAMACARENFSAAQRSASDSQRLQFHDQALLQQIIATSIARGRWNSSLDAARQLAALTVPEDEVNTTHALSIVEAVCASLDVDVLLDGNEASNVALYRRIRRANCIPTDLIQRTLDHFGPDDFPFILDIFEQGGSTIAEMTCELLLQAYETEVDISSLDQTIIRCCLALGFRGLSSRLLRELRPVFQESIFEGRATLKSYGALSAKVLNGEPIDPALERSPLYPGLVVNAFRPVGMTEGSVAQLLPGIRDQSEHLAPYTFPATGYALNLATVKRVEFLPDQEANHDLYRHLQLIVSEPAPDTRPLRPQGMIKRLLQGGFDQLDPQAVWKLFREQLDDPRLATLERTLRSRDLEQAKPGDLATFLNQSREALSVVSYDAINEIARRSVADETPGVERLQLSGKVVQHVRRLLRLPESHIIGPDDFRVAIAMQAEKMFVRELQEIQRESKKFTHELGDLEDRYVMYLSKSKPAYFGRAGAGLCTAGDTWSWNSPTFLQMMMVDRKRNLIIGNIQLHLFQSKDGAPAVLARVNPTSSFLEKANKGVLAQEMLRVVRDFAHANGLTPYLPDQTGWHQLTNRDSFAPYLRKHYGKREEANIRITGSHYVNTIFRMTDSPSVR